jgi:outer membrane protein OmpA-like peptidoglycan-associated protein
MLIVFTGVGCSSFSDKFDIAGIIDSTESWVFGKEANKSDEKIEESDETSENKEVNVEEFFPDISTIPQERPNFDELDKNFFEEENISDEIEKKELSKSLADNSNSITEQAKQFEDLSLEKKNILAVFKIRENIRLNIIKLLTNSDPLVDRMANLINTKSKFQAGDKVAIIQFADNSIIPDNSAYNVIDQIVNTGTKKNIKLIGHASRSSNENIASKRKNMEISISRAQTIKDILVKKGFSASRIFTSGKGDLEPLQKEVEKYGEAINRRVEIFFISE